MRQYVTLLKLLLKNQLRPSGEKQSKAIWIAYVIVGITFAFVIVSICFAIASLAVVLQNEGKLAEFLVVLLAIGCVSVVLFGMIPMLSALYFSRDSEFFLALPVKPSVVFLAKLTVVYLTELIVSACMLIPSFVTVGVVVGLGPWFYVTSLFAVLTVPAIPLVLIALLAIPLMYVVSFFKNKGALASIVLILLFGAFFAGYYYAIGQVPAEGEDVDFAQLGAVLAGVVDQIAAVLIPLTAIARVTTLSPETAFGSFSVPLAVCINLIVFLVFAVALLTIAALVSSAVYKKGVAGMVESGGKKSNKKVEFSNENSVKKALIAKEWRELVRTPAFAFQCLAGIVMCPLLVVLMTTSVEVGPMEGAGMDESVVRMMETLVSFVYLYVVFAFGISMNVGASTCISREGENFPFLKTIPVSYREQVRAKLTLYVTISTVTVLVSLAVSAFLAFDWLNFVCGMAFMLIYNYAYNCFCIYFDLSKPKLKWTTPNEAVKNNRSATVPMLVNMAIGFLVMIVPVVCIVVLPQALAMPIAWTVLIALSVVASVLSHKLLFSSTDRLFERL